MKKHAWYVVLNYNIYKLKNKIYFFYLKISGIISIKFLYKKKI